MKGTLRNAIIIAAIVGVLLIIALVVAGIFGVLLDVLYIFLIILAALSLIGTGYLIYAVWAYLVPAGSDVPLFRGGRASVAVVLAGLLALWWGLDVLLAWAVPPGRKVVEMARGLLHFFAFLFFFCNAFLAPGGGPVDRLLGIILGLVAGLGLAVGLIVRESDPASPLSALQIKAFQFINLFVPWHKLRWHSGHA